jgi:hypothetical protein
VAARATSWGSYSRRCLVLAIACVPFRRRFHPDPSNARHVRVAAQADTGTLLTSSLLAVCTDAIGSPLVSSVLDVRNLLLLPGSGLHAHRQQHVPTKWHIALELISGPVRQESQPHARLAVHVTHNQHENGTRYQKDTLHSIITTIAGVQFLRVILRARSTAAGAFAEFYCCCTNLIRFHISTLNSHGARVRPPPCSCVACGPELRLQGH